jgi:hypothetical protein
VDVIYMVFLFQTVRPKYLASSNDWSGWPMEGIVKFVQTFISTDSHRSLHLCWMNSQFPFAASLLQMLCIFSGFYSHVCNGVVCK